MCFVFDATGSMQDVIDLVKSQIRKIIGNFKGLNPDMKIRLAYVGYRDYDQGGNTTPDQVRKN